MVTLTSTSPHVKKSTDFTALPSTSFCIDPLLLALFEDNLSRSDSFLVGDTFTCFSPAPIDLFSDFYEPLTPLSIPTPIMEGIQTHPSNAAQAKAFTAPGSLSFPGATNELTPPAGNGNAAQLPAPNGQQAANGNGVTPATPAATPAATQGPSGITPTLQYVSS